MSEENKAAKNDSFSLMKHWLTKFQTTGSDSRQDVRHVTVLPKIVISRGSSKSINNMVGPGNSPDFKRSRSLVRTLTRSRCSEAVPMSAPHNSTQSFWSTPTNYSPPLDSSRCPHEAFQPATQQISSPRFDQPLSLPCSPIQTVFLPVGTGFYEGTGQIKSPVFRLSERNKLPLAGGLIPSTPAAWSRSDLGSDSVCGACGHHKYYGSREFGGFVSIAPRAEDGEIHTAVNSPKPARRHLKLRRTSSCRAPENRERLTFQKSVTIKKATSNIDVQKRSSSKRKQLKGTGSKKRHRSTISLTRSWSINLDNFRMVRNDPLNSKNDVDRKMSLNDTELRRQKEERRRSSLLRLLCYDKSDLDTDRCDTVSLSDTNSEGEISNYSPEVTRASKFFNNDPLEDFRSTLETDSVKIPSIYGQIKLIFQYFNGKNEFQVTLLKGTNVAPGQTGTLGIYSKVCLMPGKLQPQSGEDKHGTRNPVFYEPFAFRMSLDELLERQLRIKLYNKPGIFSFSEPVGECCVDLYNYDLTAVTVMWQDLTRCKNQKDDMDEFDFSPLERHQHRRRNLRFFLCGIGQEDVSVDE